MEIATSGEVGHYKSLKNHINVNDTFVEDVIASLDVDWDSFVAETSVACVA